MPLSCYCTAGTVLRRMRQTDIVLSQIAKFMGPTWGPSGSCWPQMGPMSPPWTLLSGIEWIWYMSFLLGSCRYVHVAPTISRVHPTYIEHIHDNIPAFPLNSIIGVTAQCGSMQTWIIQFKNFMHDHFKSLDFITNADSCAMYWNCEIDYTLLLPS